MRLTRIIAERFGSLRSATLGELGEGLTVVLGPNEAGKTSFTTLVRYVLYGYPTKRGSEPDYESDAGKRLGRLVFAEGREQWAVERTEGPHGGPVALHTLAGPDRPDLIADVTSGVSREAFRVVFGFGLDEMAQIEAGKAAGMEILSRLYAAQVGLAVSPEDVRASFGVDMAALWKSAGRTPELNVLKSRIAEVKRAIAELDARDATLARDQARLTELGERLAYAREQRDAANVRVNELAAAVQRIEDLEARIEESEQERERIALDLTTARDQRSALVADDRLLSVAPELTEVLADLSGFKAGLKRVSELEAEAAASRERARSILLDAGVEPAAAQGVDLGPDTMAGIDRFTAHLNELSSQASVSARTAQSARDAAVLSAPESRAGERVSSAGMSDTIPGVAAAVLGVAIAVLGLVAGEYLQLGLGVLVATVGVALLLRIRTTPRVSERDVAVDQERQRAAALAVTAAERDAAALAQAQAEWRAWLAEKGLGAAGDDTAAVAAVVAALREHRLRSSEADRAQAGAERELQECERYRQRLAALVPQDIVPVRGCPLDEVPVHAARVRELLQAALDVRAMREALDAQIATLEATLAQTHTRSQAARTERAAVLERFGLADATADRLRAERDVARESAAASLEAFDALAQEHAALVTTLDAAGRTDAKAAHKLELTGLTERLDEGLERYAALAVAERLMAKVQAFNEQARQPEVIRRASELLEMITDGRWVRVSIPSNASEFIVFDAESRPRPSSELSTGTAQQLYLAVRIALIETLDTVGVGLPVLMDDVLVNFDPGRKRGAAAAIGHLATHRQVVLFTCHPETAELMQEVVPGHTRLSLDRC